MNQQLPSDALTKPVRRAPWIIGGAVAVAAIVSAVTFGPAVASQFTAAPSSSVTVAPADTVPTLSASDLAGVQQAADAQQAQVVAAAAAKAAADAAAAQAAAQAAAAQAAAQKAAATVSTKRVCPSGYDMNSGDANGPLTCLPSICSQIGLPDPAHPECNTPIAAKP